MPHYIAIGHHDPMSSEEVIEIVTRQVPWTEQKIADGVIDHVWAVAGGGRIVIGNADSIEEFKAMLGAGPDSPTREWTQVAEIHDAMKILRNYLKVGDQG